MSPRPQLLVALSLALACTLTSDPFTPRSVDGALQPSTIDIDIETTTAAPAPPVAIVQQEPDVSCSSGGELDGCDLALGPVNDCNSDLDCESNVCVEGACAVASCQDGRRNAGEADVDCGGPCAASCPPGRTCRSDADCQSGVCGRGGACAAPSCDDGVRNGNEAATDCASATCGLCPDDSPCGVDAHCASGRCQAGACRPQPCVDGKRNGSETDTDCGGSDPTCARCGVGDDCASNADCQSGSCIAGACAACDDGQLNGSETAVDCGGTCGPCSPGQTCRADPDCQSGLCQDGRCCGGTHVDCTRCARRLAPFITCNTNGPAGAYNCQAFLDCLAANPDQCPVRYFPGCSDDPGGVCNHTAFGGNTGPGLGLADAILGSASCFF